MRKLLVAVAFVWAGLAFGAVFERFLDPNVPRDKAILGYLELEKQGKATATDLAELAVLLVEKGFPQDGERYLRKALRLDPKNVEARFRLGLVLQRLGKDRAAVREYRKVVKARPGYAEAQFMLALALERSGRRHAAVQAYAKAYKHNPQLADPARNPLLLDSKLQTQAQLLRYRREVAGATLQLKPIDPAAVQRMMLARPPAPQVPTKGKEPAPPSAPKPQATPVPERPGPGPQAPKAPLAPPPPPPSQQAAPQGKSPSEDPAPGPPPLLLPLGNASGTAKLRR